MQYSNSIPAGNKTKAVPIALSEIGPKFENVKSFTMIYYYKK